jgi:hypothetical protein
MNLHRQRRADEALARLRVVEAALAQAGLVIAQLHLDLGGA